MYGLAIRFGSHWEIEPLGPQPTIHFGADRAVRDQAMWRVLANFSMRSAAMVTLSDDLVIRSAISRARSA